MGHDLVSDPCRLLHSRHRLDYLCDFSVSEIFEYSSGELHELLSIFESQISDHGFWSWAVLLYDVWNRNVLHSDFLPGFPANSYHLLID